MTFLWSPILSRRAAAELLWSPTTVVRAPALFNPAKQLRSIHQWTGGDGSPCTALAASETGLLIPRRSGPKFSSRTLASNCASPHHHLHTRATAAEEPAIHDVFEHNTGTWQYVVADPSTHSAVIIDPVLDYDAATQTITTDTADSLLSLVDESGYKVNRILETHAHADHVSAASYLQNRLAHRQDHKPLICIGKRITKVQTLFGGRYGVPQNEYEGVFDQLFDDHEEFDIGNLKATAIHLPGHTPDHLGYKIGDNVFCGDSLFHADIGTARCDFPGGSVSDLFDSGRKLLSLPESVKIWTGHDYVPQERGRPVSWMTVGDHRRQNKHLRDGVTKEEFAAVRKERDAQLGEPRLLHPSLQLNIRAGRLPKKTESGHWMLRLPLKLGIAAW